MSRPTTRRRGFTLIEILVVVAIIAILAGIGVLVGVQVKRKASEDSTRVTLKALVNAMHTHLQDYPEPGTPNAPPDWLTAFKANPKVSGAIANLPGMTKTPPEIDDGYGNKIKYIPSTSPLRSQTKTGVFQSFGADGVDGYGQTGSDDIFSDAVSN